MEVNTKDNLLKIKDMEKVSSQVLMVRVIMDNGLTINNMESLNF